MKHFFNFQECNFSLPLGPLRVFWSMFWIGKKSWFMMAASGAEIVHGNLTNVFVETSRIYQDMQKNTDHASFDAGVSESRLLCKFFFSLWSFLSVFWLSRSRCNFGPVLILFYCSFDFDGLTIQTSTSLEYLTFHFLSEWEATGVFSFPFSSKACRWKGFSRFTTTLKLNSSLVRS